MREESDPVRTETSPPTPIGPTIRSRRGRSRAAVPNR